MASILKGVNDFSIVDLQYDAISNKTFAFVETWQFAEWMYVSGKLSESEFSKWIGQVVRVMLSDIVAA